SSEASGARLLRKITRRRASAKRLGEIQSRYPDLDLGSYPFYRRGEFGTSLVIRGRDRARVDTRVGADPMPGRLADQVDART
ncbi:MAG TPA: hypothetical protein VJN94_12710, partial [Candidatus Binataceae bacterium]|nr:hypothetical protein [Candidatus Binataceae bacterium]